MLRFNNKKKAMTLAEMCIVFVIIGVIASIAVVTIKPFQKSVKWLYYKSYHTLGTAIYNAMLTKTAFPEKSDDFCKALLEYINTSDKLDSDAQARCKISSNIPLTPSGSDFSDEKVQIFESNGVKLWISAGEGGKPFTHTEVQTNGISASVNYYVVWADLNGSLGPNTTKTGSTNMADIVGFVVTETSEVVPVGLPELDTRYMYAKTVYTPTDSDDEFSNVSEPMSYYEAKHMAFGSKSSEKYYETPAESNEIMSFNFQEDFPETSPLRVTYPSQADTPAMDTTNGCTAENSPCYVKIEEYY